jgi:multiple sugar transport system substrate-binding protein
MGPVLERNIMTTNYSLTHSTFSRRGFLGVAAAAASVPLLAVYGGGAASQGGAGDTIEFEAAFSQD